MKFLMKKLNEKTALHLAVEDGNIEIVKLLLQRDDIDINLPAIFKKLLNKIPKMCFNAISKHEFLNRIYNQIIQFNFKSAFLNTISHHFF